MKHEEAFYIGYFTKTKGLKGEVQLFFEFEDYEDLDLEVVFVDMHGKLVPFFVNDLKIYPNSTALIYFDDLDHIDKAQTIVKKKAYLSLDKMPERDPEEFRYDDFKGFLVTDKVHGILGNVLEINEYPQQFVATIAYKEVELLLPLNEDFILEFDEELKTLLVEMPEGLLDIYLNQ